MTGLDLEPIKARLAAATDGPWWWGTPPEDSTVTAAESLLSLLHEPGARCSTVWGTQVVRDGKVSTPAVTGDGPTSKANAEFIAHAREDVPALIAEVESLRAAAKRALDLHGPSQLGCITHYGRTDCVCEPRQTCCGCGQVYPCPTLLALDG